MKEMNTNTCHRVDDLIAFLYGELNELESRRFEHHLHECAACTAEHSAFGQIRESMMEWRDESLGLARAGAVDSTSTLASVASQPRLPAKSAWAALREFFMLSPLWMKGATAFAAVLFCVCGVLAVAYLKGRSPGPTVASANTGRVYTSDDLNKQVAIAVEKLQQEFRDKQKLSSSTVEESVPTPRKGVSHPSSSMKRDVVADNLRRPFTLRERQELAADLRLVSSKDEDELDIPTESNRP